MTSKPWPWNTLAEPSPADWGVGMTVCVAVYSSRLEAFICATDSMISTGDMSADMVAMKFSAIGSCYVAMFAGNDISAINPTIRGVNKSLVALPSQTVDDVVGRFRVAFAAERLKKAEAVVMPPGMTIPEFYANGFSQLGPELFSRLFHEVETIKLDIQFLVCGFDGNTPALFTISDPGIESHYDLVGFWAIGSGTNNAIGSLFNLRRRHRLASYSPQEIIYRALEAKFFAESAAGVGKETTCFVIYQNRQRGFLRDLGPVRNIWEQSSLRPIPDGAEEVIDKILKETTKEAKAGARRKRKAGKEKPA